MAHPLVSVVMCTYKRAHLLPRSVDSVIAQTYRPIELVLTNDGSPDDTPRVMEELSLKCRAAGVEPNFASQENGGVARARNAGLKRVNGEFVAFLDDDDTWLPAKIEKQVAEIEKTKSDACCCQLLWVRERDERPMPRTPDELLRGLDPGAFVSREHDAHINSIMVRAALLGAIGEFDPATTPWDDTVWIVQALHEARFCAVPEILGRYEYTAGSLFKFDGFEKMLLRDEKQLNGLLAMKAKCGKMSAWNEAAWRKRLTQDFDQFIKHRLYAGDLAGADRFYAQALELGAVAESLRRTRSKMRKAWWLSLIGLRLRHPKFREIAQVKG